MDCLDRTNVVQSMLARRFLNDQLVAAKILDSSEQFSSYTDFEKQFRNSTCMRARAAHRGGCIDAAARRSCPQSGPTTPTP